MALHSIILKGYVKLLRHLANQIIIIMLNPQEMNNRANTVDLDLALEIIKNRRFDQVRHLENSGLSFNVQCGNGHNLLHYLIRNRYETDLIIEFLLASQTIDVNQISNGGATPLHMAVLIKDEKLVSNLIITQEADINIKAQNGITALELAATTANKRESKIFEALISSVNSAHLDNGLIIAIQSNNIFAFELLLKHGAFIDYQNEDGMTCLMAACKTGNRDLINLVLKHSPDVNAIDKLGNNCANYLIETCHYKNFRVIAQDLVISGVNFNNTNNLGVSCKAFIGKFMILDEDGSFNILNNFLHSLNQITANGSTIIHHRDFELFSTYFEKLISVLNAKFNYETNDQFKNIQESLKLMNSVDNKERKKEIDRRTKQINKLRIENFVSTCSNLISKVENCTDIKKIINLLRLTFSSVETSYSNEKLFYGIRSYLEKMYSIVKNDKTIKPLY